MSPSRARQALVLASVPVLVAAVTGCGVAANKVKSLASSAVNKGVSDAAQAIVGAAFTDALSKAGVTLAGDPDCSSDLQTDVQGLTVKGTVSCTGKTDQGKSATGAFKGVIAVGDKATSCKGHFTVKVDGHAKVNKDVDVCELAKSS
jgi:hypothetical protein